MNDLSHEQEASLSFSIKTEDEANDDRSSNLEISVNNISGDCDEANALDEMDDDLQRYNDDNDNNDDNDHDEASNNNNNQIKSNRNNVKSFDLSSGNNTSSQNRNANIQQLKKHMTLDLDAKTSLKKARKALLSGCLPMFANQPNVINQNNQRSSASSLFSSTTPLLAGTNLWTPTGFVQLESPDLRKCQLPTPELDRFILNNTNIHLTPTPSLANPHFAFDKALERIKMKDEANQATAAAAALAAVTNSNHNLANGFATNHLNNHTAGHHLNHHNNSLNAVAAAAAAALQSPLLQFPSLTGLSNGNASAMAAAAAAAVVANSNNHHNSHSNHSQHLNHHLNNNNNNSGTNHMGHQNSHQISSPTEEALLAQLIDQTPLDSMELQYKINQLLQRAVEFDANKSLSSNQHTATSAMVGLSTISNSDSNSRPPSNASSSMYAMNLNGGLESCDSNSALGLNSRANSSIGTSSNVANSNSNSNLSFSHLSNQTSQTNTSNHLLAINTSNNSNNLICKRNSNNLSKPNKQSKCSKTTRASTSSLTSKASICNDDSFNSNHNQHLDELSGSARGSNKAKTNGNPGNNSSNVQMETIDFEDQERMKLERKRMRNRIAASKCRKRKLERISKLEDKVKELKDENADLSGIIFKLREHVCQLKAEMMEHVKSGCNINPSLAQS